MLMSAPPWAIGTIAALVAVIYILFEYAHRQRMARVRSMSGEWKKYDAPKDGREILLLAHDSDGIPYRVIGVRHKDEWRKAGTNYWVQNVTCWHELPAIPPEEFPR